MSSSAAAVGARPQLSASTEELVARLRHDLVSSAESAFSLTPHSIVYHTYSVRFSRHVAVKIINKRAIPQPIVDKFVPREIAITKKARHPHLVRALAVYEPTPQRTVIIYDWYENGTLLSLLSKDGPFEEHQALRLFRQLIEAVHYLHVRHVVHRDIKLENVLIDRNHDVRLADFGFARSCQRSERSTSFCGTPFYSSPQFERRQPYDPYADWFACGIVLYTILHGHWPMFTPTLKFPKDGHPSAACRRLLLQLLHEEESERAGYDECVHSEWMADNRWVFADSHVVFTVVQ